MSDEELDSVFRRVADEYPQDVPPPDAWERLETRLATTATAQQLRGKVLRGLGAEITTLAVLLWLGYRLLPQLTPPAQIPVAALPAARHATAAPGRTLPAAPASPATKLTSSRLPALAMPRPLAASPAAMRAGRLQPAAGTAGVGASLILATSPTPTTNQHRQPASAAASELVLPGAGHGQPVGRAPEIIVSKADKILDIKYKYEDSARSRAKELSAAGLAEAPAASRAAQLKLASHPLPAALAELALLPPADSAKEPKRPAARPPYRLVLGLLGAPAFSAVRTPQTAQLGGDYGLTLEYVLAPRLRVRAGLIRSQKRYRAASTDYVAPASWQWYPGDYMLDGNCRITEIPLDVRFDMLRRPAYAVFTSLGINSLLMRNERYSYDWTMNGQTFTKTAQVIDGSNHFLSVLNVAVGVERPIGGRWSAQVEPFWQIPLGGVGAGQVRLSSAGAAFSLKFGLIR